MTFSILAAGASGVTPTWVPLAYLIAGVFFILALRGLSSPATSRAGKPQWHDRHVDRGCYDSRHT